MLRRLLEGGYPLEGAADHGVSEALYLRDPGDWPRDAAGRIAMATDPLDLEDLLRQAD